MFDLHHAELLTEVRAGTANIWCVNCNWGLQMSFSYDADPGMRKEGQGELELDVAIVGAGISGLYSGWRLRAGKFSSGRHRSKPPETHVFELSNRVGGRLLTVPLLGMPHVRCELGGMRYILAKPTECNPLPGHQMVHNLGKKLGLTSVAFPMGDGNGMYYLRRQRCWTNDIRNGFKLPYNLAAREQGKTDDDLFNEIVRYVLDKAKVKEYPRNRKEWNEVKKCLTFEGRPTYALGFWNLLSRYFSSEGYLYLQDINGYDSNTMNWNAGEAIQAQIGDFGSDINYYTFQEGYDSLAHGIAESFCNAGGKIWIKNGLVTFSHEKRKSGEWLKLVFFNEDRRCYWHVYARKLVLAMPRRSLELLDQTNFFFDDRPRDQSDKIRPYIQSVIIQPSFKLLLGYSRPWWRPHFDSGRTITDLPTRQVYYFGTEEEQPDGEKGNTNSLLMASYTDEWASDFWRPLEEAGDTERWLWTPPEHEARRYIGVGRTFSGKARSVDGFQAKQAPELMVEYSQKQLREIHGNQIKIPDPYVSTFYDWGDDPYGGGYHAWAGGFDIKRPWDAAKHMRRPFPQYHVHVCGEAYSDQQGWVEGALCTAELMLKEHFKMKYPDWLPRDYYFGW